MKPDPVILPVCESCGAVGVQPGQKSYKKAARTQYFCLGQGAEKQHSRTPMKLWNYKAVSPVSEEE